MVNKIIRFNSLKIIWYNIVWNFSVQEMNKKIVQKLCLKMLKK